jgi:hypothetical protein
MGIVKGISLERQCRDIVKKRITRDHCRSHIHEVVSGA